MLGHGIEEVFDYVAKELYFQNYTVGMEKPVQSLAAKRAQTALAIDGNFGGYSLKSKSVIANEPEDEL